MDKEVLNTLYADNDKLLIDEAIKRLKAVDWTFEYSDDSRISSSGLQLFSRMLNSLNKLPKNVASILWDEYCKFKYNPERGGYKNPYKEES